MYEVYTKVDTFHECYILLEQICNIIYYRIVEVFFMILTKQSQSGRFIAVADLSIPALEIRHLLHDDVYEVVCRYVGNPNYNSTSLVKRMFKNIELF